jgi:hypothetical protein
MLMVSQRGAVSVTNPSGPDLPERATYDPISGDVTVSPYSSIPPLRTPVFNNSAGSAKPQINEYRQFWQLFIDVGKSYPWTNFPGVNRIEFEYKKTTTGLVLKQVRPVFTGAALTKCIFLPEKATFYTYQAGLLSSLEETHKEKCIWEFESSGWLPNSSSMSGSSLFSTARVTLVSGAKVMTRDMESLSSGFVSETPGGGSVVGTWSGLTGTSALTFNNFEDLPLTLSFPYQIPESQPFLLPSDAIMYLTWGGATNPILLTPRNLNHDYPPPHLVTRTVSTNGVTVEIRFWRGVSASVPIVGLGPTEYLWDWDQTTITGLTEQPIILKGYFSQTYAPSRHNSQEEFLFEPSLEPGLPPEQLQQLAAKNIQRIYAGFNMLIYAGGPPTRATFMQLVGSDGVRRSVPLNP